MRSRTLAFLFAMVFSGLSSVTAAQTIFFNSTECPSCSNTASVVGNEWSSFGLTVGNFYWYTDTRDTFDGQGLSVGPASVGGAATERVRLNVASDDATIQFWVIGGNVGTYSAFDESNALIESFVVDASRTGDILGTHTFDGLVKNLTVGGNRGFVQLSTLTIAPIPEPEIYAMLAAGLGLMGYVARRRKQQIAAA